MEAIPGLKWAIARVVKKLRTSKGWTQEQLAGFSGLSSAYITKVERGLCGDSLNALVLLAQAFCMRPSEVLMKIEMELEAGPEKPESSQGRPQKECSL